MDFETMVAIRRARVNQRTGWTNRKGYANDVPTATNPTGTHVHVVAAYREVSTNR